MVRDPLEGGTWDNSLKDPTWLPFFHDLLLPSSGVVNVDGVNPDVRMESVFVE